MHNKVLSFGLKPVKPPRSRVALGFDPDADWVCYSRRGHLAFLPRAIADEFDHVLAYRRVGVHHIFGVEEMDLMRTRLGLFGLAFGTVDEFALGLQHIQREGDVLDEASGRVAA